MAITPRGYSLRSSPDGYVTKNGAVLTYKQRLTLAANAFGKVCLPYGEKGLTKKRKMSSLSGLI